MGRYDLSPQMVHKTASMLLETKRIPTRPPWYDTIGTVPPPERLVRPPMQRSARAGKKASRLFQPLNLNYKEDELRSEFFNDHPWELARPRVVLEDDGRDLEKWDWSHSLCRPWDAPRAPRTKVELAKWEVEIAEWEKKQRSQASRPINGESVVQRQHYLMTKGGMSREAAYDKARKELYTVRHAREVENRVAKEEALMTGAFFGLGPLEVGMQLEDEKYKEWREWAEKEAAALKHLQGAAYTGNENADAVAEGFGAEGEVALNEVGDDIAASKAGQGAFGGTALHP